MKIFLAAIAAFALGLSANARDLDKLYKSAKLKVGNETIDAYVADTDDGRSQGLMFIEKLPSGKGMLFVFEREQPLNFWMKNTLIPLAIGFFDKAGVLIDVQEMKVAGSLMDLSPPSYQSRGPALFALEMNAQWFAKHGIKNGARLQRASGKTPSVLLEKLLPKTKQTRP